MRAQYMHTREHSTFYSLLFTTPPFSYRIMKVFVLLLAVSAVAMARKCVIYVSVYCALDVWGDEVPWNASECLSFPRALHVCLCINSQY